MKCDKEFAEWILDRLDVIAKNDKTEYDYRGKLALRRDGTKPESGRWLTPREIANVVAGDVRKYAVNDETQEGESDTP